MRDNLLTTFLESHFRRVAVLGSSDCILMAADWAWQMTGRDPAADLRGAYRDAAGARAIVLDHGGLLGLVRERLEGIGLRETWAPVTGCIGVLDVSTMAGRVFPVVGGCVGIRHGGAWVIKSLRGIGALDVPHVAAWDF